MLRASCSKIFSAGLRHVGKRGYSAAAAAIPAPIKNPDIEYKQVGHFMYVNLIVLTSQEFRNNHSGCA